MHYKRFLLYIFLFSALAASAGTQLIMQCEFRDFFKDFKISGALGFSSESAFAQKIYADKTMVGVIYHPAVGFHCAAFPLPFGKDEKRGTIAKAATLMWPAVINGVRDKLIHNYRTIMNSVNMDTVLPAPINVNSITTMVDQIVHHYAHNYDLVQKTYDTVQETITLTSDTKHRELLQRQADRLQICLKENNHEGIS